MRRIEEIITTLEKKIIGGTWPVGMRLPSEASLGDQFKVSRTVVREALEQLRGRHLISTVKGSGSYVSTFSQENLTDSLTAYTSLSNNKQALTELLDLRLLIEAEAASKLAITQDKDAIQRMQVTIDKMRSESNLERLAEYDLEFHLAMVEASNNSLFVALISALKGSYISFSQLTYKTNRDFIDRVVDQHVAILVAIRSGDALQAADALRGHIENSRSRLPDLV